jgi:choloylglycine hydrolase
MDLEKGIYYYRTYENSRITAVALKKEDFGGEKIVFYPFEFENDIFYQN